MLSFRCIPLVLNMQCWEKKESKIEILGKIPTMMIHVGNCAAPDICFHHKQLLNGKTLHPVNETNVFYTNT